MKHHHHGAGGALLAALATARATVATLEAAVQQAETAPTNDAQSDLLALKETSVSVRTSRAAIAAGELPAVKVGREFKVRRADLDAWLAARAVKPRERQQPERELTAAERAIERARRSGTLRIVGGAR
jgi:excisionase family DNA binding protein